MKYEQPFGITDPNASYINGNPSTGVQGSIPPAAAFEFPMREIVAMITNSGFTPSDNDLAQLSRALRQGNNFGLAATVGGNANVLTLTNAALPLDTYRNGLTLRVQIPSANTGPVTINVDNLGAINILRNNGAQLSAGDLPANSVVEIIYVNGNFQIVNFQGFTSQQTNNNNFTFFVPYILDSSATPNQVAANFSPPITGTIVAGGNGGFITVKLANSFTGAAQISVNGMTNIPITRPDGTAIQANDAVAGEVMLLMFSGTSYQLMVALPGAGSSAFGALKGFQVFTASGTYVPSPGAKVGLAFATGGGGAGGVALSCGGGGGAGSTAAAMFVISGPLPVIIGAGGIGVTAPFAGSGIGGSGGTTSLGTILVAPGGQGGPGTEQPGHGGTPSTGQLLLQGGDGQTAYSGSGFGSGNGGASFWGGGGKGAGSSDGGVGGPGRAPGSGGGGADSGLSIRTSGNGQNGIVVVLEF